MHDYGNPLVSVLMLPPKRHILVKKITGDDKRRRRFMQKEFPAGKFLAGLKKLRLWPQGRKSRGNYWVTSRTGNNILPIQ